MANIAVFCGSAEGNNRDYVAGAGKVGRVLASRGYGIVYGGGSIGLMGALANSALAAGGEVIGVIPRLDEWRPNNHNGLTEMIIVNDMQQRKRTMSDLSCAALALPGGLGTADEFTEYAMWSQLGFHKDRIRKHVGLLNLMGFYFGTIRQLDHAVRTGFMTAEHRKLICHYESVMKFLEYIESE